MSVSPDFFTPLQKPTPSIQSAINTPEEPNSSSFFTPIEQESLDNKIQRQGRQYGVRLAEGTGGLIGDLVKLPGNLLRAATGGIAKHVFGKDLSKDFAESDQLLNATGMYGNVPGSNDLRKFTKETFNGKFEPQGENEETAGNIINELPGYLNPATSLGKALTIASASNFAPRIAKALGASEETQEKIKMVTAFIASFMGKAGRNSAEKLKNDLYETADLFTTPTATVSAKNLTPALNRLERELLMGGSAKSKTATLAKIGELKDAIQVGRAPIRQLTAFKQSINEARSGLWQDFGFDSKGRATAKKNLDNIANIVDDTLSEYGKTNPAWHQFYREANEVHGAIANSARASNFIENNVKKYAPHTVASLLVSSLIKPASILGLGAKAGAVYTGIKGTEIVAQIMQSPVLRRHYFEILTNAAKQDAASMNKSLELLDKKASEDPKIVELLKGKK